MRLTKLQTALTVLFATALVVANITASKLAFFTLPLIGGVAVPAGFVAIGVSFLCTDLLSELYGRDTARDVVNATVVGLIAAWILVYVSILLPVAPFYPNHGVFVTVMGGSATIITAGILTTLVSQNIDVGVFHYLRTYTNGRYKWLRNLGSTSVSQFVDTALFIILGFVVLPQFMGGAVTPLSAIGGMIIGQYAVKLVVAAFDTPLFYLFSGIVE